MRQAVTDAIEAFKIMPAQELNALAGKITTLIDIDDPEAYVEIKNGTVRILKPRNWRNNDYTSVVLFKRRFAASTKIFYLPIALSMHK